MSTPADALFTYLWHYLIARLVYDELLAHGSVATWLIVAGLAVVVAVAVRRGRTR